MTSFAKYGDDYERIWSTLSLRPGIIPDAQRQAQKLAAGKAEYLKVESRTGVPWWFVGLCHYREGAFNFETYLGNGQPLDRRTTIVPKERGPFTGSDAFLDGAADALQIERLVGARDWSLARALYRLEGFNGYGYHAKGVNSPYLWGGSTAYGPPESRCGKYVRDGDFDPDVVDRQLGAAVVLKRLMEIDGTIRFADPPRRDGDAPTEPDDEAAQDALWLQRALNRLGAVPTLAEDGRCGPRTRTATSMFQTTHGLDDTGLADARTIAAIQRALQPPVVATPVSVAPDPVLRMRLDAVERQLAAAALPAAPGAGRADPVPIPAVTGDQAGAILAALDRQIRAGAGLPDLLKTLAGAFPAAAEGRVPASPPPGQVKDALGATLGGLLDGRKSAIGIIGAVLTQILSQVPPSTGLGQVLGLLTPAAGLSPYTMPLFLALTAWGVLGKLEKWSQPAASAPPS